MNNKNFFIGSLWTPLIVGGIIAAVSILVYLSNPEFSVGLFFTILTVLVFCSLINFAKTDEEGITFFSFLFLPTRYKFSDIVTKITIKAKDDSRIPSATILLLKNGKRKQLKLGLYPVKTQQKIQDILSEKIIADFSCYRNPNRLNHWLQYAWTQAILKSFLIGTLLILIGFIFQIKTMIWDWRISHWERTTAEIVVNQTEITKIGETEKEENYQLRYRYIYQGKSYTGSKIAGDSKRLELAYVPGSCLTCIVNPEKPEESALLSRYRADWLMSLGGWLLIFIGFPFLLLSIIRLRKKILIPDELKKYSENFDPEKLQELTLLICGECKISVGKISGKYREIENRYGCFPPAHSVISIVVQLFFVAISIILGTQVMPHFLLVALMILVLTWKTIFPRGVVFDRTEKKLYWFRFFSCKSIPAKIKRNDVLNEADLVALGLTMKNDGTLILSCVRKDGVYIPVAAATGKRIDSLLSDAVKIAENLGKIPIIII